MDWLVEAAIKGLVVGLAFGVIGLVISIIRSFFEKVKGE